MSTDSNVFSQGGGGTIFEINIQTAYFISFLLGGYVPGVPGAKIVEFRQQAGSLGYQTDDLLLRCQDEQGLHRLLMQVKHAITITEDSPKFIEVVSAAWKDFRNSNLFDPQVDKIYLISAGLPMVVKNHLFQVLSWAKSKDTFTDFINEVNRIDAKKKYYEYFKTIIGDIEVGIEEQELYKFLRCYEILDYDLDQNNSVTKAGLLTLLDLAKEGDAYSAIIIWNEIFEMLAASNPTGGFYTLENRPTELMNKLQKSYLSPVQKELLRMSRQSQELLDVITDKIGGYRLDRTELLAEASDKLGTSQVVIVTGDAGAGKSAISKALLVEQQYGHTGYVLALKADELLSGQLHNWFRNAGCHYDIKEIFSHFSLLPHGIVYVDGLEKLLEDAAVPFKQLLVAVQQYPAIKLVASCRKSLLNVLTAKFFLSTKYEELEVPYLDDAELELVCVALPALKGAVSNPELQQLVRIPKYLDFAYTAIAMAGGDYSNISEIGFQDHLWSAIVENVMDGDKDGLPLRRRTSFIDIAVTRTRKMQQYVAPTAPDPQALDALNKETVILQLEKTQLYAPAHDVLEDWALARFTDHLFATKTNDKNFFELLGMEAPMRRAYRLWVQYALKQQAKDKIDFLTNNLTDATLDHFWHTESLIAVLSSSYCGNFLQNNLPILQANDWSLMFKVIHVMRTAAKVNGLYMGNKVLIPTGYGWGPVLHILQEYKETIPTKYFSHLQATLSEWSMLVFTTNPLPAASRDAGLLAIHLLNLYVNGGTSIHRKDRTLNELNKLVFAFTGGITSELPTLFSKAKELATMKWSEENYGLINYGENFLELALDGLGASQLSKYMPEQVIALAKERWYRKPAPPREGREGILVEISQRSSFNHNFEFGIASNPFNNRTCSAYQTQVYWLLLYHTELALDFIVELLNYSTDHYRQYPHESDHLVDIILQLPGGGTSRQTGSYFLWAMYRGLTGAGNSLLKDVLMALEKYLLEIGEEGEDKKEHFRSCLSKILTDSRSVALTAVVASAVQAHPVMAGSWMLPLLDQPAFYKWDISRYVQDKQRLFIFRDGSIYTNERVTSHDLPHRTKYTAGLRGFIMVYSVTIGILNPQIFELIDKLKAVADPMDLDWRKTLEDIDARQLVATKETEHEGGLAFEVETRYSEDVSEMVERFKQQQAPTMELTSQVNALRKAEEGEVHLSFQNWLEIYQTYQTVTVFDFMHHAPGLLAKIGVRDFWAQLDEGQKEWCFERMGAIIANFTIAGFTGNTAGFIDTHVFDSGAVVSFLPKLLSIPEILTDTEDRIGIEKVIFRLMLCDYQDNSLDYNAFLESIQENFWPLYPELATKLWKGVLAFGHKDNPIPLRRNFRNTQEFLDQLLPFIETFIEKIYTGSIDINMNDIDITEYNKWSLEKVLRLVPDLNPPAPVLEFLKKELTHFLNTATNPQEGTTDGHSQFGISLKNKFAQIFFESAMGVGPALMEYFCKHVDAPAIRSENDLLYSFFYDALKQTIILTDNELTKPHRPKEQTIQKFQTMWKALSRINQELQYPMFFPVLLLKLDWRADARHWPPLEGITKELENYIWICAPYFTGAVINLLSTIGDQTLLPRGLQLLVNKLIESPNIQEIRLYKETNAEQLANRIYNHHLEEIRSQPSQLAAYRWLLEKLIDEGSTDAYWLNEFVMSYHRQNIANASY